MSEELPALQINTTDYVTSLAKGTFGAIPDVGLFAAEMIHSDHERTPGNAGKETP